MKTVARVGVVLSMLAVVALLSGAFARPGDASEEILVGLVASQTTDLATYGKVQLGSVEMAVEKVNAEGGIKGHRVRVAGVLHHQLDLAALR